MYVFVHTNKEMEKEHEIMIKQADNLYTNNTTYFKIPLIQSKYNQK